MKLATDEESPVLTESEVDLVNRQEPVTRSETNFDGQPTRYLRDDDAVDWVLALVCVTKLVPTLLNIDFLTHATEFNRRDL